MAEAEAPLTTPPPRFFCHKCNVEIGQVREDFTCPTCGSGFIEEVTNSQPTNAGAQLGGGIGNFMQAMAGGPGNQPFDLMDLFGGGGQPHRNQGQGQQGQAGSAPQAGAGAQNFGTFGMTASGPGMFTFSFGGPSGGGRGTGQTQSQGQASGNASDNPGGPVEHMLYTFLSDLILGLGGENADGQHQHGAAGMPVLGNLGDYVWGRDGLDAIVTQLMNQMEGSGPPPLPAEKLDELPTVSITQEHIDRKLHCSVCWDDFKLLEEVKQLECEHVYHPDCILPWLKLHGTCPICRRDFTDGRKDGENPTALSTTDASSTSSNVNATGNHRPWSPGSLTGDILNLFNIPAAPRNPSSGPNSITQNQSQAQQGQGRSGQSRDPPGPPPDLDMDMEFD